MAINLIPVDIAPKSSVAKIANFLKTASAVGLTIFILAGFGLTSFYLLNYFQLRGSLTRADNLKGAIASLQKTEADLVLVRDRLSKVKTVLSAESADQNLEAIATLFKQVPPGVTISDLNATTKKTEMSITAANSLALSQFMAQFISGGLFETINLKSFGFNPQGGYAVSFEMFR